MADITLTATVTRDNLESPAAALDINDDVNYVLGRNLQVGTVNWEKTTVTSPFSDGRFVVNERRAASEGGLEIYALGSTFTAVMTNLETLKQAFSEQHEYTLQINADGHDQQWLCERADYEVGFVTEMIASRMVPVRFTFYRHPVPIVGVF